MRSTDFLEVFSRRRGDAPTIISSGISGAVWRHGHRVPTIYNAGMSYTAPAAFGLCLARPDLKVVAIEGDGSFLMGLANFATLGRYRPENLVVIVYNNKTYLPTGTSGELTSAAAHGADLAAFASAAGIEQSHQTADPEAFDALLDRAMRTVGPWVLVADVDRDRQSWTLQARTRTMDRVTVALEFEEALQRSTPPDPDGPGDGPVLDVDTVPEVRDGQPGWRSGSLLYTALRESGIDAVIYLPEGMLYPLQVLVERDQDLTAICCSREDEGVAIASGFALAGKIAALVVEGTGVGMSATALAGLISRRNPLLIVSSHGRVLGVRKPWDDIAAMVNEPVLDALGIPVAALEHPRRAGLVFREAVNSAATLRRPVGVVIPPYVMDDDQHRPD